MSRRRARTLAAVAVRRRGRADELRTPAVSLVAARRLALREARWLVVFGRRPQARAYARAARARCPKATVRRGEDRIELRFLGPDCDQGLDIDLRLLGSGQDPGASELRFLARLAALGYAIERLSPDEGP